MQYPKYLLLVDGIIKLWYVHVMEYCDAVECIGFIWFKVVRAQKQSHKADAE